MPSSRFTSSRLSRVPNDKVFQQASSTLTATARAPLKFAESQTNHLPPQVSEEIMLIKATNTRSLYRRDTLSTSSNNILSTNSSVNRGPVRSNRFAFRRDIDRTLSTNSQHYGGTNHQTSRFQPRSPTLDTLSAGTTSDITHFSDEYCGMQVHRKVSISTSVRTITAIPDCAYSFLHSLRRLFGTRLTSTTARSSRHSVIGQQTRSLTSTTEYTTAPTLILTTNQPPLIRLRRQTLF